MALLCFYFHSELWNASFKCKCSQLQCNGFFLMISWGLQLMSLSDGSNGEIRGNDEEKKLETLLQPACFITDPNAMWLPSHSNMMMSVTWQRCLLDMHYKCAVNIKYVFRVKGKASQTCKRAQMRWRLTAVCVSAKKWRSVRETRNRHTNCSYMIKQHFPPIHSRKYSLFQLRIYLVKRCKWHW